MTKLLAILRHITVVLAFMFLVFLVLDQFNPMMNFVDNAVSRWLLAGLCVSGVMQSAVGWGRGENALSSEKKAAKKHECDGAPGGDLS